MARTVVAIYESVYVAKKAILELLDLGYARERIDLRTERGHEKTSSQAKPEKVHSEMVLDELQAGSAIGAGLGGSLSIMAALLMRLGDLNIPFLEAIGAGNLELGAQLGVFTGVGLVAGGIFGSLFGGLIGLGVPENEIQQYAKTVRRNKVTVIVMADWDAVDGTIEVLEHHNPLEIQQKSIEWKKMGGKEKRLADQGVSVNIQEQDRPR